MKSITAKASQKELRKSPTGIRGLDEITGGGLPAGRSTLVCGGAGCGKTLLATEFLVSGVKPGQFEGAGFVVLAVRVLGVKMVNFKDGEALVPHTELVGAYECTRRCTEFFD